MLKRRNVSEVIAAAEQPIIRDPFCLCCSPTGRRVNPKAVECYLDSMMSVYELLSKSPFDMALPETPLRVFIVPPEDLTRESPFYDVSNCTIFLPSSSRLPTFAEEFNWMATVARHEVAHAMSHRINDNKLYVRKWHWLCEGFAVWVETLFPGDYFLIDAATWSDHPETSLLECQYDAFPFVAFVVERLGKSALKKLWLTHHDHDPWSTILDLLVEAGENRESFFVEYCINSYVLNGDGPLLKAIFDRFGHRHAELARPTIEAEIEALACRYYRVGVKEGMRSVHIVAEGSEWEQLQASVAQILPGPSLGNYSYSPKKSSVDLTIECGEANHILVTVSNDSIVQCRFKLHVNIQ